MFPLFPTLHLEVRCIRETRTRTGLLVRRGSAEVIDAGARDSRLASALGIEDCPSIASPLGRDLSDLEPLRSSNEFTPQWGSAARERSASAKRPSPLTVETDRSKARRASPKPSGFAG